MTTPTNPGTLDSATLAGFQEAFESQPSHQLMQNVVTQHDVNDVALNRNIVAQATNTFSTVLDDWRTPNMGRLLAILSCALVVLVACAAPTAPDGTGPSVPSKTMSGKPIVISVSNKPIIIVKAQDPGIPGSL